MHRRFLPPSAAEVRENQRAVIMGQLAGDILHDFNNILTVITGTIDILAGAVADRPELAAITSLIGDAAVRGAKLTSHLLAFAHGQPSQPGEIDVNAVVAEACGLLRATLGVEIEIALMLADDVPPALADPAHLAAAILNLALVARNEMSVGGKLIFRTGTVRTRENTAAVVGAVKYQDAVVIAVHAGGHETVDEHPRHIFIDTDLVEDFVRGSGGRVKVNHRADGGALAEIFLPKARSKTSGADLPG